MLYEVVIDFHGEAIEEIVTADSEKEALEIVLHEFHVKRGITMARLRLYCHMQNKRCVIRKLSRGARSV